MGILEGGGMSTGAEVGGGREEGGQPETEEKWSGSRGRCTEMSSRQAAGLPQRRGERADSAAACEGNVSA